jgi:hypothetical protein
VSTSDFDSESSQPLPERDASGRFIKSNDPKVSVTIKSNTPITTPPVTDNEPLISFRLNNPFRKFFKWLDYVRRHQATTFAIKVTVPLIALPVIIFAAYKIGFNKANDLVSPNIAPSPSPQLVISKAGILRITTHDSADSYWLLLADDTALTLQLPENIDVSRFVNKRVLITGDYDSQTNILTVTSLANFELLPSATITSIPTSTPYPTLTPSPTPEYRDAPPPTPYD